jgi:hypothetical protein
MHVCADKAEWEHIHFFHGNGDLGIILGLVARNKGLALGRQQRVEDLTQSLPSPHILIVILHDRFHTPSPSFRPQRKHGRDNMGLPMCRLHMGYPMQSQNYRRVHELTHIWLPVYIQGQCRAICGEDGFLTPPSGQTRLKIRAGGL